MNTYELPRSEYPRPQMVREEWMNLNGEWEFEFDFGKSGKERGLHTQGGLSQRIVVPFCPESRLSGIGYKDFIPAVWYSKCFELPSSWKGKRILIHFGAVDYSTEVWINGEAAGTHYGGYSSFSFDITHFLKEGANTVKVYAEDDTRSGKQPTGKQSKIFDSFSCFYTRTTGIWQTVWLECVPENYIASFKITTSPENKCVYIEGIVEGAADGLTLAAASTFDKRITGSASAVCCYGKAHVKIDLSEVHLWEPGVPKLYDLDLCLLYNGVTVDAVKSYFGLRSVSLGKKSIRINGKPVFQRLVLDQGFYPDGIYTAPSDEMLKHDIDISMELGFNGARMHEKIFEPRYLYWADTLGYLVWGEHGNWGLDITTASSLKQFLPEWVEAVQRDFNHPSLVGWCPFNETVNQDDEVLRIIYKTTKTLDPTRPVIDSSGHMHVETDIFDVHDYDQDIHQFAARYDGLKNGTVYNPFPKRQQYKGQPFFVSEYGGIWWNPSGNDAAWGYGKRPDTKEEFLERYSGLTLALLKNPYICAFCYTQLYDVEQEVNGLYTYDRKPKFDPGLFFAVNSQTAGIEE